jgi:hypothetical protein
MNLARLTVVFPGGFATARLGDNRRWYSSHRLLQSVLRTEQTPYSPADGQPGRKMVLEAVASLQRRGFTAAAQWLGGEPRGSADLVYSSPWR